MQIDHATITTTDKIPTAFVLSHNLATKLLIFTDYKEALQYAGEGIVVKEQGVQKYYVVPKYATQVVWMEEK